MELLVCKMYIIDLVMFSEKEPMR